MVTLSFRRKNPRGQIPAIALLVCAKSWQLPAITKWSISGIINISKSLNVLASLEPALVTRCSSRAIWANMSGVIGFQHRGFVSRSGAFKIAGLHGGILCCAICCLLLPLGACTPPSKCCQALLLLCFLRGQEAHSCVWPRALLRMIHRLLARVPVSCRVRSGFIAFNRRGHHFFPSSNRPGLAPVHRLIVGCRSCPSRGA